MRRAVAVFALLAVAGCGGGSRLSKQQYEQHLKRDATLASKALTSASTAAGGTPSAYANRIAIGQRDLTRAADDLEAVTPPADAEQSTRTIVTGLRFLARQLGRLRHAALTTNQAEAAKVSAAVAQAKELRAVTRAVKDLQRKGYDVGVFGS